MGALSSCGFKSRPRHQEMVFKIFNFSFLTLHKVQVYNCFKCVWFLEIFWKEGIVGKRRKINSNQKGVSFFMIIENEEINNILKGGVFLQPVMVDRRTNG